jgi:hypothetical protein
MTNDEGITKAERRALVAIRNQSEFGLTLAMDFGYWSSTGAFYRGAILLKADPIKSKSLVTP